jgi:hypothetical protein
VVKTVVAVLMVPKSIMSAVVGVEPLTGSISDLSENRLPVGSEQASCRL